MPRHLSAACSQTPNKTHGLDASKFRLPQINAAVTRRIRIAWVTLAELSRHKSLTIVNLKFATDYLLDQDCL